MSKKMNQTNLMEFRRDALSHFMLAGHSPSAEEPKALLTIHQAKKKSEVSPGVGKETDMFVVANGVGSYREITELPNIKIVKDLDGFYKNYKKTIDRLDKKTEDKIKDYLKNLSQQASSAQEVEQPKIEAPKANNEQKQKRTRG